jgi:deazaflavin-dependent oxidoreductase (nitroreductase family)
LFFGFGIFKHPKEPGDFGDKSARLSAVCLLFYRKTSDGYLVVRSRGGARQHPGWYRNIHANPDVDVQVGTAKMKARARTATGEERARLWEKALEFWPPTPITSAKPSARTRWSCSTRALTSTPPPKLRSSTRRGTRPRP